MMTKQARLQALNRQIRRLEGRVAGLEQLSYRYSWLRIGIIVAGLLAAGLALFLVDVWLVAICLIATTALFGLAVFVHHRVERGMRRHQILIRIKSAHTARALLDWDRIPRTFPHQPRPQHPFEVDLDLVGESNPDPDQISAHRPGFAGLGSHPPHISAPTPAPASL
jgi:hypothetical protein